MKKVGIISDTHGFWDDRYEHYMGELDEIWHAGDIGSTELAERFEAMKPHFRAVCGNCDGGDLRLMYPETLRFKCEEMNVLMKHIGGYPGKYDPSIRQTSWTIRPNYSSRGTPIYCVSNMITNLAYSTSTLEPRACRVGNWNELS